MGCDDYETIVMQIVFEGMSFYSDDKRLFFCELFLYAVHHAFILELKIHSKLLCNFERNEKYYNKTNENKQSEANKEKHNYFIKQIPQTSIAINKI